MNILHSSDWHLGKSLGKFSRIEEQKEFVNELYEICISKKIDLLIISGDIFDSYNPSSEAEDLYFSTLDLLSKKRDMLIFIIAGNHDSPSRLFAPTYLLEERGILISAFPMGIFKIKDYGFYKVLDSAEGFIELEFKGEKAIISHLPYLSESRLRRIIFKDNDELSMQKDYSSLSKDLLKRGSDKFRDDTINLSVSHSFVVSGIESDSERLISVGGSSALGYDVFSGKSDYIALGHLHRPQKINKIKNAYYAGSPIHYHKNEASHTKSVNYIQIVASKEPIIEVIPLKTYKAIELLKADSVNEMLAELEKSKENNSYAFLELKLDAALLNSERLEILKSKEDIVELELFLKKSEEEIIEHKIKELDDENKFKQFYKEQRGVEADEDLLKLFLEIFNEVLEK